MACTRPPSAVPPLFVSAMHIVNSLHCPCISSMCINRVKISIGNCLRSMFIEIWNTRMDLREPIAFPLQSTVIQECFAFYMICVMFASMFFCPKTANSKEKNKGNTITISNNGQKY